MRFGPAMRWGLNVREHEVIFNAIELGSGPLAEEAIGVRI
jgi:hypothetical protein